MDGVGEPTLVQTLRAHASEVSCADACGARLASGGGCVLRLWTWTASTGWSETATVARAHRYGLTRVRWAPGGALVASCGVDGAVRLWGRRLQPRRTLAAPAAPAARALCWPGPGRLLAGYDDGSVCVWATRDGRLVTRLAAHEGALHALCAPAGGALLLAACTDAVLKVFDLEEVCRSEMGGDTPSPLFWLDGVHDLGVLCAEDSEDGRIAATGGHDSKIRLFHIIGQGTGRRVEVGATLEGHVAAVTCLRWARGVLASAALDRTARLWAAHSAICLRVLHAHKRYLTCIVIAPDLSFMITGSNDKTIRTWSLGAFTIDDEMEPACSGLAHFGLGDLEGIGPVDTDDLVEADLESVGDGVSSGAQRVFYSKEEHDGAINSIAAHDDLIATASSDGLVRVFRWCEEDRTLRLEHELGEKRYPALTVHFGANGAVLLSGGMEGEAIVWDVQSGCRLRSLSAFVASVTSEGEAGGGGVRAARVSPHRPPLLLLATDDGLAPVWSLADDDPAPIHVYAGHAGAVSCCAWAPDGRVACTGAAGGELRLHTAPPAALTLHHEADVHDLGIQLGVQSCDFASSTPDLPENSYKLVTAGNDSLIKIWVVELTEDLSGYQLSLRLLKQLSAHTGGVSVARWDRSSDLIVTGGADRWARVWSPEGSGLHCKAALPTGGVDVKGAEDGESSAGGVLAAAFATSNDNHLLALGTISGELELWQLPNLDEESDGNEDDGLASRFWSEAGVTQWLRDYITRVPGVPISKDIEAELIQKVRDSAITGSRLHDDSIADLLYHFGYYEQIEDPEEKSERELIRDRLIEEISWLRRDPLPPEIECVAPHSLRCPLTHRALREPARAADGCSYERAALHEWFAAADGAISPISGRRLRNAKVLPNYALREAVKEFYRQHQPG